MSSTSPLVSIVLPLYNAKEFIEQGLRCVKNQTFQDWELVAVNDGSTDDTAELFQSLTVDISQPIQFTTRENGGGFEARNTGLDLARGKYIAFFDIDDTWIPEHLERLVEMLETYAEVDWVWALNRVVDITQDKVLTESTFIDYEGRPYEVTRLKTRDLGPLKVIDDERAIETQILYGLRCGQQYSLIRREVFENYRFRASYRNEGADQVSVIRSLNQGFTFAYLEEIHGDYAVHMNNASAGAKGASPEKYLRLRNALIQGFQEVLEEENLSGRNARAIHSKIAGEHFWNIGYNIHWKNGNKKAAMESYRKGLGMTPWDLWKWKTYLLAKLRS
jgi:glycosyltransferase involved in cell wall biosynthesis